MGFLSVVHSDRGIKKNTNQDSVLIKEASTDYGDVMLAVVCDGMGGLAKGEVASAALIKAFSMWFEVQFPELLYRRRTADGINRMELENEINKLILDVNQRIDRSRKDFPYCDGNNCGGTSDGRREILYDECGRLQSL